MISERVLVCEEQSRLTRQWGEGSTTFSSALSKLSKVIGTVSKPEYDRWLADIEKERLAVNSARHALECHRREHGC
jgi:hypothetical protein